jgi:uncharacterized RDD family membrane protein YckC
MVRFRDGKAIRLSRPRRGSTSPEHVMVDRIHTVRTPEMVEFSFRLAGLGARFLAWLVDCFIILVILIALVSLVMLLSTLLGVVGLGGLVPAFTVIGFFVVMEGYFIFFEWRWSGRTPGKKVMDLRVIQDGGVKVTVWSVFVRNLFRAVDGFPLYLVGGIAALLSEQNKRLGDLVAGTVVVREERERIPKELDLRSERYNTLLEDPVFCRKLLLRLTKEERELLLESVFRRDELDLGTRSDIFRDLAAHFQTRLGIAKGRFHSDEKFILNLAEGLLVQEKEGWKL